MLCKQYGPPDSLAIEEVESPRPGANEVVVSVKAASLNFPDVLIIQNKYQFKPPLPFSPGSELAGVVKEVGPGVERFKPGDRVMAFTTYGAFAEEVKTEATRLIRLPQKWISSPAPLSFLTYGTTDHALRDRAAPPAVKRCSYSARRAAWGLAAVEVRQALGARVIACASTDEKLAVCRDHGADERSTTPPKICRRIRALTGGRGADVVYDPVGGPYSEPAFRSIAWRGRHLVVGFAAARFPSCRST